MTGSQTSASLGELPRWLFYTRSTIKPFLGFIHADTREQALLLADARGWRGVIALRAEVPYPSASREWIESEFKRLGSVLPGSTADTDRKRTPYFYRKLAISWVRFAREQHGATIASPCRDLAKTYLSIYRGMKHLENPRQPISL